MFCHLGVDHQIYWEDENPKCRIDKAQDHGCPPSCSIDGDQEAEEDEDAEDAEHEAAADGEVDLGLEGEDGESDDDDGGGGGGDEDQISIVEHAAKADH